MIHVKEYRLKLAAYITPVPDTILDIRNTTTSLTSGLNTKSLWKQKEMIDRLPQIQLQMNTKHDIFK